MYLEDPSTGELGWILDKKYWNHGYTTEAAKALMDYASHELVVKHFVAHCDSANVSSYRVMEKLEMVCKEKTFGRKNKASEEERYELMYERI